MGFQKTPRKKQIRNEAWLWGSTIWGNTPIWGLGNTGEAWDWRRENGKWSKTPTWPNLETPTRDATRPKAPLMTSVRTTSIMGRLSSNPPVRSRNRGFGWGVFVMGCHSLSQRVRIPKQKNAKTSSFQNVSLHKDNCGLLFGRERPNPETMVFAINFIEVQAQIFPPLSFGISWWIFPLVPSGNETWQWKIKHS